MPGGPTMVRRQAGEKRGVPHLNASLLAVGTLPHRFVFGAPTMRTAELHIVMTSADCVRYQLIADGKVSWSNRVEPSERGHQGARSRMAAWALRHGVTIEQAELARVAVAV